MHAQCPSVNAPCGACSRCEVSPSACRKVMKFEIRMFRPTSGKSRAWALGVVPDVRAIQRAAAVAPLEAAEVAVFRPEAGRAAEDHALRGHGVEEFLGQVRLVERGVVELRPLPEGGEVLGQVAGHGRGVGPAAAVEIAAMLEPLHVGEVPGDGEGHAPRLAGREREGDAPAPR